MRRQKKRTNKKKQEKKKEKKIKKKKNKKTKKTCYFIQHNNPQILQELGTVPPIGPLAYQLWFFLVSKKRGPISAKYGKNIEPKQELRKQ